MNNDPWRERYLWLQPQLTYFKRDMIKHESNKMFVAAEYDKNEPINSDKRDILTIMEQTNCNYERAQTAYLQCNKDIVDAIMEIKFGKASQN